jgi:hypothetical protein
MRNALSVLLCAFVLAGYAAKAVAQASPRSGFGMSFGMGAGSTGITCEDCGVEVDDRLNGVSGYLRLGGYASSQMFIGVEGTGWIRNSDGLERRIAAASLVFVAYPSSTAGLFLRAGAGGIRAVIENDLLVLVGEGITWNVGLGFDLGSGPVALTPFVTYLNSLEVAADVNEVSTGVDLNPNILQFGLAITTR